MSINDSGHACYSFEEVLKRLDDVEDLEELRILAAVVDDDRHEYSLFHLKILNYSFGLKREELQYPSS